MLPGYNSNVMAQHDWLAGWLVSHGVEAFSMDNHGFGRSTARDAFRGPPLPPQAPHGSWCAWLAGAWHALRARCARAAGLHDGLLGYVGSWDALCDDAAWFAAALEAERGQLPTFLYGESMGGALALCAAERLAAGADCALAGLVLSAPMCAIGAGAQPHAAVVALGRALALLAPAAPAPFFRDLTDVIFRDPARRAEARANPLRFGGGVRLGTAFALKAGAAAAARAAARAAAPLLILHGSADAVCPAAASRDVLAAARARDKTLVEYDGAWHAVWAEPVETRRRLLADVIGWLAARARGVRAPAPDVAPDGHEPLPGPRAARAAAPHGLLARRPRGEGAFRDASHWSAQRDAHALALDRGKDEGGQVDGDGSDQAENGQDDDDPRARLASVRRRRGASAARR